MTAQERAVVVRETWPASVGRNAYLRQLAGKANPGRREAMQAKCAECCNGYVDGKNDCGVALCPLYPFMPYRAKESPAD